MSRSQYFMKLPLPPCRLGSTTRCTVRNNSVPQREAKLGALCWILVGEKKCRLLGVVIDSNKKYTGDIYIYTYIHIPVHYKLYMHRTIYLYYIIYRVCALSQLDFRTINSIMGNVRYPNIPNESK